MSSSASAPSSRAAAPPRIEPAFVVILAGVCAALHVGKLPPAIPVLQTALSISLVQAGFLLSMLQLAGMSAGVAIGALADGLTPRRSMLLGLGVLTLASAAGGLAQGVGVLMALRAAEGLGFLLVVLGAPALIRRLVAPARMSLVMGLWAAYMPLATALALLIGPWVIDLAGWRAWWWALAAVSAAMAMWLARAVGAQAQAAGAPTSGANAALAASPASPASPPSAAGAMSAASRVRGVSAAIAPSLGARLVRTLSAPGPWLLAMSFSVYAGQWLAVIGFLPTIYAAGGTGLATAGVLTAIVAAVNMGGNIGAGRLLHRSVPPVRLLVIGFTAMGLGALFAFAQIEGASLPSALRFAAVLVFSGVGGLIPATLFTLAVRLAPGEGTLSTTVGWMQQGSALGQFCGPPLVAYVAARAGGWHFSGAVTGAAALAGLALAAVLARYLAKHPRAH